MSGEYVKTMQHWIDPEQLSGRLEDVIGYLRIQAEGLINPCLNIETERDYYDNSAELHARLYHDIPMNEKEIVAAKKQEEKRLKQEEERAAREIVQAQKTLEASRKRELKAIQNAVKKHPELVEKYLKQLKKEQS